MIVLLRSPITVHKDLNLPCSSHVIYRKSTSAVQSFLGIALSPSRPSTASGGVFSTLSLIFKSQVDVLATVAYALVVVCPTTSEHLVYYFVTRQVFDGLVLVLAYDPQPHAPGEATGWSIEVTRCCLWR